MYYKILKYNYIIICNTRNYHQTFIISKVYLTVVNGLRVWSIDKESIEAMNQQK